VKYYKPTDPSPANEFKSFCEQRGLACHLVSCVGRGVVHSRRLVVAGRSVQVRKLGQGGKDGFYYKIDPVTTDVEFVAYAIPDSTDYLVLPAEYARKSTMFSLSPDLDRASPSQRHSWASYVNNIQQLSSIAAIIPAP
jgi:hypothetical protein